MTTSIELFKFTNPHPTTKAVQWMNNEQVMRKLIKEIIDEMQSPDDVTNGAYFWLETEGYTIEAEIEFSAYWVASWERFDWGYEDVEIFGAKIASNNYSNGQGEIIFDGGISKIGAVAFRDCSNLLSIKHFNSTYHSD